MSQENKGLFDVENMSEQEMHNLMHSKPGAIVRVGGQGKISPVVPHDSDEAIIGKLLKFIIGEDPDRGGLQETPERVVKAWKAMTAGYQQNPADVLKAFEDGAEGTGGQWVIVKDIPIYSNCEHHLLPFFGTATIGYVPDGKVVGLSKLARLADVFAKRLQVQERLTNQVAEALMVHAGALAACVVINCRHFCMESRGISRTGATTLTLAYKGDESHRDNFHRQLQVM